MHAYAEKTQVTKSPAVVNEIPQTQNPRESAIQFEDNRPETAQLNAFQTMANNSPRVQRLVQLQAMANNHNPQQPIQKKENNTGLPDNLKTGIENLSGYAMDDVKVHRNSDKPAQLQAHAYAQRTDIHLAPGQEKHLPHEAWHVVQQKQGRVKPTMQLKSKVNVNDDATLEQEADVMGEKALNTFSEPKSLNRVSTTAVNQGSVQRVVVSDDDASKILLDKFNRQVECVQTIAASIYTTRYRANTHAIMPAFDDLYDAVDEVYDAIIHGAVWLEKPIPISEVTAAVTEITHKVWLAKAEEADGGARLPSHKNMKKNMPPFLKHYNLFDTNMIWRWTSKPSTEQVYTAKTDDEGKAITYDDIVKVVAAHSGGNDKSNPYVKTLSFGRNPAALMGVAASAGGDKHVLNIIDKTEFLYGIDISTLASKGITAHAASARMISLFESEYILVNTPGFPSFSLNELATFKYKNPFKENAIEIMLGDKDAISGIEHEMGTVEPEDVPEAVEIDLAFAQKILVNAIKTRNAATPLMAAVQDKEDLDPRVAAKALTKFSKGLRKQN